MAVPSSTRKQVIRGGVFTTIPVFQQVFHSVFQDNPLILNVCSSVPVFIAHGYIERQ